MRFLKLYLICGAVAGLFFCSPHAQSMLWTPEIVEEVFFSRCNEVLNSSFEKIELPVVPFPSYFTEDSSLAFSVLDKIRAAMESLPAPAAPFDARIQGVNAVHAVFYPLSGTDAGIPQRLFPKARVIIAMDSEPFRFQTTSAGEIDYSRLYFLYKQNYPLYNRGGHDPNVAGSILASLQANVVGFRPLQIKAIRQGEHLHGIIKYDLGPGTDTRIYLHLNVGVDTRKESYFSKVLPNVLDQISPQAVVAKASRGLLGSYVSGMKPFRKMLFRWLNENHGYLVEGGGPFAEDGQIQHIWDFSEEGDAFLSESLSMGVSRVLKGVPFGYYDHVRLTRF